MSAGAIAIQARAFAKECREIAHVSVGERRTVWLDRAIWADQVEAFAQQHRECAAVQSGAIAEIDRLRASLADVRALVVTIRGNAAEITRRADQELAPPTMGRRAH